VRVNAVRVQLSSSDEEVDESNVRSLSTDITHQLPAAAATTMMMMMISNYQLQQPPQ